MNFNHSLACETCAHRTLPECSGNLASQEGIPRDGSPETDIERDELTHFERCKEELWFGMSSLISVSPTTAPLPSLLYSKYDWLKEFITTPKSDGSRKATREDLKHSLVEFDREPDVFMHRLTMLAEYLSIRDLTENMTRWATTGDDSRLKCWAALIKKLDEIQTSSLEIITSNFDDKDKHVTGTQDAILRFKKLQIEEKSLSSTADNSIAFLNQVIKGAPEEAAIRQSSQKGRYLRLVEIWKNWGTEIGPRKILGDMFTELSKQFSKPTKVSVIHQQFQHNLKAFSRHVTGVHMDEDHRALETLRRYSKTRNEQWKPIFPHIEQLSGEATKHEHIITCLAFRHAIENLPGVARTSKSRATHSSCWGEIWTTAVENELGKMLHERILVLAKRHCTRTTSAKSLAAHLRQLLQNEFDHWAANTNNRQAINSMVQNLCPNVKMTEYWKWKVFNRGKQIYGDLSSSIHSYADCYHFKESHWLKNDSLILAWLKPEINQDGEVDWDKERARRGL